LPTACTMPVNMAAKGTPKEKRPLRAVASFTGNVVRALPGGALFKQCAELLVQRQRASGKRGGEDADGDRISLTCICNPLHDSTRSDATTGRIDRRGLGPWRRGSRVRRRARGARAAAAFAPARVRRSDAARADSAAVADRAAQAGGREQAVRTACFRGRR